MVCSVTPPSASFLATSPISLRSAPSFKRNPTPRSVNSVSKAIASSVPCSTATVETFERLEDKLCISQPRRRSSPVVPIVPSNTASGDPGLPPVTFGFNTRSEAEADVACLPIPKHRPQKGLLSRALTSDAPVPQPLKAQTLPLDHFKHDVALAFPDVDTAPLADAQRKYRVFGERLVETAYLVAAQAYHGLFRKNGDTVLTHCLETAVILADLGLDAETVAAALLHEVLHLKCLSRSQLEEFVHNGVVQLVENSTTLGQVSQVYRDNRDKVDHEDMHQMHLAMNDVRAVLLKLADRVENMRTISALPLEKQKRMAQETLDVYSVIANRLGVWCLKAELEDLSFAVLHPQEYKDLTEKIQHRQSSGVLESTINKVKAVLDAQGVKYEDISGRSKNLYGVWLKFKENKTTDSIYDVIALRVVVSHKHDCYRVHRAVTDMYHSVPGRFKDYVRQPKETNGYQSLHDTVVADGMPVEIQIRTHKMHYIAEYGFAAHWKYKEKLDSEAEWLEKQVHYQKWLTTYKLGVHDKKVRPSGSPPSDSSLKALGLHRLRPGSSEVGEVDPFLKNERFKLEPPRQSEQREYVLIQHFGDAKVLGVKPGSSLLDLLRSLDLGVQQVVKTLVNNVEVPLHYNLKNSDIINIEPVISGMDDDRVGRTLFGATGIREQWFYNPEQMVQPALS